MSQVTRCHQQAFSAVPVLQPHSPVKCDANLLIVSHEPALSCFRLILTPCGGSEIHVDVLTGALLTAQVVSRAKCQHISLNTARCQHGNCLILLQNQSCRVYFLDLKHYSKMAYGVDWRYYFTVSPCRCPIQHITISIGLGYHDAEYQYVCLHPQWGHVGHRLHYIWAGSYSL